ncbi:MAG TPA: hypothetical protein QF626_06035 [Prochlorococcaceae cyanobacterium Fu_MAG_50]|nr:hypothetical protein [Prochlorococcaceae cyanobacterium Fu_MAG_50]
MLIAPELELAHNMKLGSRYPLRVPLMNLPLCQRPAKGLSIHLAAASSTEAWPLLIDHLPMRDAPANAAPMMAMTAMISMGQMV